MKCIKMTFVVLFMGMLTVPFLFANRGESVVSETENRILNQRPLLIDEDGLNAEFTHDYEEWFLDNLGFRNQLTNLYAKMQYYVFDNIFETDIYTGKSGDLIYATDDMIEDYQHLNLRSPEEVTTIGESYQVVSDWLGQQGIQFYYVQCYDKHSIYPERFMEYVNQNGTISKTDQVIRELTDNTTVNVISLKETLLTNKEKYNVFCHYWDPSHWSYRGAFLCYQQIMQEINRNNSNELQVLSEEDFQITVSEQGKTIKGDIYFEDFQEIFLLKNPRIEKTDIEVLQEFGTDPRHSMWKNANAENDMRLLIVGDSYGEMISEYLAEGFSQTALIWGDYIEDLDEMITVYQPDIVVFECAERVDRSLNVCNLAEKLRKYVEEE